jgi:AcrR family transcriptional regulator
MRKGETTRLGILEHACALSAKFGLEGLSIGALAGSLGMSKSGLFAHFGSKSELQLALIEHAAGRFVEQVVKPALSAPRGEARLVELFERWLSWFRTSARDGGCFFVAAAAELDDRPGAARSRLLALQLDLVSVVAGVSRTAVESGDFALDLDPQQLAFELHGLLLSLHYYSRLLGDERAEARARAGFQALVARARAPSGDAGC